MNADALAALLQGRPLLRPKDVCRRLGIAKSTLYAWLAQPEVRFPRPTYVHGPLWSPEKLEAWLALREKANATATARRARRPAAQQPGS